VNVPGDAAATAQPTAIDGNALLAWDRRRGAHAK
jgi:hypothetical protein